MAEQIDSKIPKIRFKGFEDGWLEDQLGERVEFFSGLTYSPRNVQKGVGTLVLRSSNVKNGEIVNADNVYVDPKIVNSKNVEIGDIAVVVRNGSRSLIGKHAQIKSRMDNTVIGAFMTGIHSASPAFTNALLGTPQFDKEVAKNLGATINQITTGAFRQMMFRFPRLTEQTQIGGYFRELDSLIGLHQRKHDKLVTLKKAMLQKMFPQAGATTPEIRFKGFEGMWEETKLGEVCGPFEYGLNASAKTYDGRNKYIRITDIDEASRNFSQTNLTTPDADLVRSTNYLLTDGDMLFARTGASVGKTYRYRQSDGRVFFAGFLIRAKVFNPGCVDFIFCTTLTSHYGKFVAINSQRSGQPGINASEYSEFTFRAPSAPEQQKIGTYFRQLDELISKHAIQLQKLKQLKSACLEKMFV